MDYAAARIPLTAYRIAADQAHAFLHRDLPNGGLSEPALRWMVAGLARLTPADLDILTIWLEGREHDIAQGREDLGVLRTVFAAVMGREPQ